MDKYVKKWVMWCDSCGHGFKIDADELLKSITVKKKLGFIDKILKRKPQKVTKTELPEPSPCPVCGKTDNVTVIKLQKDKFYVQPTDRI